jgi:MATE efflux family protein
VSLLFNPDERLAPLVAITLIPVVIYQLGDMLQIVYANALRGLEHVRKLVPISILCHLLVAPILGYLFAFVFMANYPEWQLLAVWSAFPISLTLIGILLYRDFYKNCNKENLQPKS